MLEALLIHGVDGNKIVVEEPRWQCLHTISFRFVMGNDDAHLGNAVSSAVLRCASVPTPSLSTVVRRQMA